MTPIIPFLIFLFFNGIANLVTLFWRLLKKTKPLIPQIIVLSICSFIMYPAYIKAQANLRVTAQFKKWEDLKDPKMNAYIEACKFCKDLPDTVRVISRKPELFYMFSGYKKSDSFPWYVEPDEMIDTLKSKKATHVILDNWYKHAYVAIYPAVQKYPEKFKVLKKIGDLDTVQKINPTYVLEFNDEWGYHGKYVDGLKTGEGYELFQDGRKYVGEFANNAFNGSGTLYDSNGNIIFKGLWQNGRTVKGEGELIYMDERKYVGQISNNMPHGYGTLYDKQGNIIRKGNWQNGVPVD
jgi:hypothetical protein